MSSIITGAKLRNQNQTDWLTAIRPPDWLTDLQYRTQLTLVYTNKTTHCSRLHNRMLKHEVVTLGSIQKFPDWVDNEINSDK
jgi:hypothetical protein